MKSKKRLISFMLTLVLLAFPVNLFASDIPNDEYKTEAYLVENGIVKKLSEEELIDVKKDLLIEENNKNQTILENTTENFEISPRIYMVDYTFKKDSEQARLVYNEKRRVTPYVKGPMDIGMTFSSTVTKSIGGKFGASAEGAIKRSLEISGTVSSAKSEAFNFGGSVPRGKTGYIQFTPRMSVVKGVVTRTEYKNYKEYKTTENITAYYPIKIGSYADGLYEIAYQ